MVTKLKCPYCGFICNYKPDLEEHLKTEHWQAGNDTIKLKQIKEIYPGISANDAFKKLDKLKNKEYLQEKVYKDRLISFTKIPNPPNYKIREPILAEWFDKEPAFKTHSLEGWGFDKLVSKHQRARGKTKEEAFKKAKKKIDKLAKWNDMK